MAVNAEPPPLPEAESTDIQAADALTLPSSNSVEGPDGIDSKEEVPSDVTDGTLGSTKLVVNTDNEEVNDDTNQEKNVQSSTHEAVKTTVSPHYNTTKNTLDFSKSTRWSVVLRSPSVLVFSPSLNPNRPGSLHGLGK
jgi:hypothetical protein